LGLEDLEAEVGRKKRPEFWERLWVSYVQSKLDWRLSKTDPSSSREVSFKFFWSVSSTKLLCIQHGLAQKAM